MRILNGVLALILILFAAVQFNDPDGPLWMLIYGFPAFWTALAAIRPTALALKPLSMLLSLTVAVALLGVVYYWPDVPGWWRTDVWWETETAREGMGMMIAAASLFAPITASVRAARATRIEERRRKEAEIERRRTAVLAGERPLPE